MIVTTDELARHLADPGWVIFDCRHDLMDPARGERWYREGHIPGAHFAAVDTVLSGAKNGRNGRHPLPAPEAFADFLGRHGVSDTTQVVACDDVGGQYSARLWWMARWIGLTRVALLDGGYTKWLQEARPVTTEIPTPCPALLHATPNPLMIWTSAEVEGRMHLPGSLLVDARAPERFRGEVEPIDRVAGHIPGAKNRFFKMNLNADATLRPPQELRSEFQALIGVNPADQVGHQCGSGITACANLFAMEYAGLRGSKLYAGSWSEWISDPARPIAKGE